MTVQSSQVRGWLAELDAIERDALSVLAGLSAEQANWRPAPGKWSIAECVAHLRQTGTLLLDRLERVLAHAREEGKTGPGPARLGWLGGWFARTMERPGKRPMPSPANFVPPGNVDLRVAEPAWRLHHARLRRTLELADGLALDRIRMASVAQGAGWLRLNAAAWLASALAHERRHLLQMRNVRDAPGFPA
ncbi:MAG: DinB family protein [Gemmatimonadales bacterium]